MLFQILQETVYCIQTHYMLQLAVYWEKDRKGREQVISYGGRALRAAEKNYGIRDLELLTLVEGVKHYNVYLSYSKFNMLTDHQAPLHFQKTKETQNTGKLERWTRFLQSYNFEMVYKKGTSHGNADALSRRQYQPEPKTLTATKLSTATQTDTHFVDFNPATSICQ